MADVQKPSRPMATKLSNQTGDSQPTSTPAPLVVVPSLEEVKSAGYPEEAAVKIIALEQARFDAQKANPNLTMSELASITLPEEEGDQNDLVLAAASAGAKPAANPPGSVVAKVAAQPTMPRSEMGLYRRKRGAFGDAPPPGEYALTIDETDRLGRTHICRNIKHHWQGTEQQFVEKFEPASGDAQRTLRRLYQPSRVRIAPDPVKPQ